MPSRIHNVISGLISSRTYRSFNTTSVTKYYDGTTMTDAKVDNVLYFKDGSTYCRRTDMGTFDCREYGANGDGLSDDTVSLQKTMDAVYNMWGRGVLYLPPTFQNQYITNGLDARSYVNIIGDARTQLVAKAGSTKTGVIIMKDSPLRDVVYKGFAIVGNSANSAQHGFDMTASTAYSGFNTGGIWYSQFQDIQVTGIQGNCLHMYSIDIDGAGDLANQFLTFTNVRLFNSGSATSRSLYSYGQLGQALFQSCQFDGQNTLTPGSTCIELISHPGTNGTDNVYATEFHACTVQSSDFGVKLFFAKTYWDNVHRENVNKMFLVQSQSQCIVTKSELASQTTDNTLYYVMRNESSFCSVRGNVLGNGVYIGSSPSSFDMGDNTYNNNTTNVITVGFVRQATVSAGVLDNIYANKHIFINLPNASLQTINSLICTGEELTLRGFDSGTTGYYLTIGNTGNINLPVNNNRIILRHGDTATFKRSDNAGNKWVYVSKNISEIRLAAPPTAGAWLQGEKIWNNAYNGSNPLYWICIVGSTFTGSVPNDQGTWVPQYSQTVGSTTQRTVASDGSLTVNSISDVLLNTSSTTFKTITSSLPVGSEIVLRVWENGSVGSTQKFDTTGNLTLPGNVPIIYGRANEVLVFRLQNLAGAGTWVLKSSTTRMDGTP